MWVIKTKRANVYCSIIRFQSEYSWTTQHTHSDIYTSERNVVWNEWTNEWNTKIPIKTPNNAWKGIYIVYINTQSPAPTPSPLPFVRSSSRQSTYLLFVGFLFRCFAWVLFRAVFCYWLDGWLTSHCLCMHPCVIHIVCIRAYVFFVSVVVTDVFFLPLLNSHMLWKDSQFVCSFIFKVVLIETYSVDIMNLPCQRIRTQGTRVVTEENEGKKRYTHNWKNKGREMKWQIEGEKIK